MDEVEQDTRGFKPLYIVAQVAGFVTVILTGIWMGHYRGGFAWSGDNQFNWHPLLMVMSLIYLYGNGILIYRSVLLPPFNQLDRNHRVQGILMYRVFRNERKKKLKWAHAIVMISAFFISVIGLKAVFDFHATKGIPDLYSLHSWMGLITVIMFLLQWVAGLVTFLFPGLASHLRSSFMPAHIFFGLFIFTMACATALLGITEKAIFSLKDDYKSKGAEATLLNWVGVLLIIFGVLVVYLAQNPRYKRLNRPEDEMLLTETLHE
ncbi:transmembrane ascorbate-dependent reductase CYB561-like isoform X1 [Tigriopus californicus]|uniref:transmembrane ascorbate-dependent reductase CYB561-like isoform X1 n=1 Tax=Tigriopus californicus TaxID=6832 RepID=UPI0027DA1DD4|nr:transmembrane ascorbate-dependent reductase CYB561-like isoform X1 [Tigriopus californicus]XP_059085103.1 transmembrane ascorbate-dependent reductase CYB561-like isoform X1 [Tigriopus californicus]